MKTPIVPAVFAALSLTMAGCGKQAGSAPSVGEVKPVRETSFEEVTKQLDPGGSVYAYLATDQWLAGLSTNVAQLASLLGTLPNTSETDREQMQRAFGSLAHVIEKSGLENLSGVGVSGIQVTPELSRTKLVLHHGRGKGDGIFWNVFGKTPHAFDGFDLLPESTAIAAFGDLDVALLWKTIEQEVRNADIPELTAAFEKFPEEFEAGTEISWDKFLGSLAGEGGLILTLNEANKIQVPFTEGLVVPEPGLLFAIKVKNEVIYNRVSAEMKKTDMARIVDEKGLKMTSIRAPLPVAMDLEITVASAEDYLFVASSSALVRQVLDVRAGKADGLRKTTSFAELLKYLPKDGNNFFYADRRFSGTLQAVQKAALAKEDNQLARSEFIQRVFNQKPMYGLAIGRHTDTGWESVVVGSEDSATAIVAAPALGGTAMVAAMALPALAKAKEKSKSVQCVNNLRQIGLALRIWAGDHDDRFPFQVEDQAKGGTKAFCDLDSEGYDRASYRHFQAMANELSTTRILVCPDDESKQPADAFVDLSPETVTYQLRTGPQISDSNPLEVVGLCPIHRHVLRVDGSVQRESD